MAEFPASEFRLDGEPAAIRASASRWTAFGTAATDAAAQIRALDSSLFIGPEGDQYRAGLHQDLPPHLDTTGRAYTTVGTTLTTYASTLDGLQDRMAPLRVKAPALWEAVQQAQGRVGAAHAADHQHELRQHADARDATTFEQAPDTYRSDLGAAMNSVSAAENAWNDCLTAARSVTADLRAAVGRTDKSIRDAADLRFAHNPHGVHALVSDFKNFVTDHAKGLSQLSGALKIVSGIAGVLSFIPVVGEVALAVSLVTAGAALLIDASIKYATGKGSWTSIAIDGTLLALPFGIGKGVSALRSARSAATVAEDAAVLPDSAAALGAGAVNKVGGTQNCVSCAIAGDSTLAGSPASALKLNPDVPFPNGMAQIQNYAGATWRWSTGRAAIESELLAAGDRARGIVYGARADGTAHVWNAVVQRGQVHFVDFQSGGAASFDGYSRYAFIGTG